MVQIRKAARLIEQAKRPVIIAGHGVLISRPATSCWRWPRRPRSRSSPRCSASAPSRSRTHCTTAGLGMHGWVHCRLRGPQRGPGHRHRHALRRPRLRQVLDVRAEGQDHPHRHRPGRDRQERARAMCRSSATSSACCSKLTPEIERVREPRRSGSSRSRSGSGASRSKQYPDDTPEPVPRPQVIDAHLRGHARQGDHRGRRGPAPDVRGPALPRSTSRTRSITSGGLGTMGFSLPAAIGAQCPPGRDGLVHVAGDGGFQMIMPGAGGR